jgi:TonB family protein
MTMSKTKLISSLVFCIFLFASWMYGENQERIIIETPFKPVKTVYPDYPEILKKEGVAARVRLFIFIDKKGNVRRASVWIKSLYPELEEILEEVLSQWKFEPPINMGQRLLASGFVTVIFFPGKLSPPTRKSEYIMKSIEEELSALPNEELQMILDKCTEYCLKLSESALYYICHEKIKEKYKRIKKEDGLIMLIGSHDSDKVIEKSHKILALGDTEKNVYVYDYQLIKKEGNIEEKRVLMEKDGKDVKPEDVPQGTKPSYTLKPVLVPVQILGIEHRSRFSFRLVGDKKIKGKLAYVIEAYLKPGQTGYIRRGRIWVGKSDFRIVKVEVETEFVEGFEQILAECNQYYFKPHFKSTYYYEIDKNGLLFPSRSKIRVEYSGFINIKRDLKSELEVTYGNYQFFTVKWSHETIKKKLEALFSNRSKLTLKNSMRLLPSILRYF